MFYGVFVQTFILQVPYPRTDGSAEGVVDDIIRFAPAHLEEVLSGFGCDGTQAADEDDVLGFEFREKYWEEIAERVVKKDVQKYSLNRQQFLQG